MPCAPARDMNVNKALSHAETELSGSANVSTGLARTDDEARPITRQLRPLTSAILATNACVASYCVPDTTLSAQPYRLALSAIDRLPPPDHPPNCQITNFSLTRKWTMHDIFFLRMLSHDKPCYPFTSIPLLALPGQAVTRPAYISRASIEAIRGYSRRRGHIKPLNGPAL